MVGAEVQTVWADALLESVTLLSGGLHIEAEVAFLPGAKEVVENAEPFLCVQFRADGRELAEVSREVGPHTGEVGAGFFDGLFVYADGNIPLLHDAVVGAGDLVEQHVVVFPTQIVQPIAHGTEQDTLFKIVPVNTAVVDGDFGGGAGIQRVQQLAVIEKHLGLVVFAGYGVVDVLKAPALAKFVSTKKKPVRPDAADGNGVLYGLGNDEGFFILLQRFIQGLYHMTFSSV